MRDIAPYNETSSVHYTPVVHCAELSPPFPPQKNTPTPLTRVTYNPEKIPPRIIIKLSEENDLPLKSGASPGDRSYPAITVKIWTPIQFEKSPCR